MEVKDQANQVSNTMRLSDLRLAYALLLSLFLHALILSLHFGAFGIGMPSFTMPWKEKRVQAPPAPAAQTTLPALPPIKVVTPPLAIKLQNPISPPPSVIQHPLPKKANDETKVQGLQLVEFAPPEKKQPTPDIKSTKIPLKKSTPIKVASPKKVAEFSRPEKSKRIVAQELNNNKDFSVRTSADEENEQATIKAEQEAIAEKEVLLKKEAAEEEKKIEEQKLTEQKLAEQKLAEQKLAEQKLAEQKLAEQKLAEQKLAEQKLVEQKLAEQKLAEQKLAEQKLAEQKLAEQKLAEQKLAEQKLAEQKLAEQKLAEQKLAEQKLAEQKLAEQKLAEQKLVEQKLAEQKLVEQKLAEQKLAEQKLVEQKLVEQKLVEQKLVEQKLAEQKLAEQKLAEQKLAEQKLAQAQAQAQVNAGLSVPAAPVVRPVPASPPVAQVDMMQRYKEQARQIVKESDAKLRDSSSRRRSFLGSFDKEVPLRMYVDAWKQKIERNGNFNYSQKAKDQARAEPLVTVAIRSDGSVEEIVFHRSSGRADIDEAVRRIIRVNAPYAAFPPNLAAKYDVLEIKRVWSFQDVLRILEELP